jgi:hypothetical protein
MSLKCCQKIFFVRTTQLPEYVNISGLGHTHTHARARLSASARLPTTPLLYTSPAIQLLTTPTHTFPASVPATTSPPLYPTSHTHGYYAVVDYSSAATLSPGLWARSREIDEKGQKGKPLWVHTHPRVSYKPRGRCVQSLVQIGSEMWICIRYKHTHKLRFRFIYKIQVTQYGDSGSDRWFTSCLWRDVLLLQAGCSHMKYFVCNVIGYARSQNCEKRLLPLPCLSVCLSVSPSVRQSSWEKCAPTRRVFI